MNIKVNSDRKLFELDTKKLLAFCCGTFCLRQKKSRSKNEYGDFNGYVVKENAYRNDFYCPDCGVALYWSVARPYIKSSSRGSDVSSE